MVLVRSKLRNIDFVLFIIKNTPFRFNNKFDTVLMNPPFGTKHNAGVDIKFLDTALRISQKVVYSLHKTSTR